MEMAEREDDDDGGGGGYGLVEFHGIRDYKALENYTH